MVTALGSGSGKTFIVTGIAGALKKEGLQSRSHKSRRRHTRLRSHHSTSSKNRSSDYSSIKIGESGWTPLEQAITQATKDYNFFLVEGAMSAFTGLLNENYKRPMSTAEVAAALGASTILVVGCDKEGIEGALINTLNYVNTLKSLGVNSHRRDFKQAQRQLHHRRNQADDEASLRQSRRGAAGYGAPFGFGGQRHDSRNRNPLRRLRRPSHRCSRKIHQSGFAGQGCCSAKTHQSRLRRFHWKIQKPLNQLHP